MSYVYTAMIQAGLLDSSLDLGVTDLADATLLEGVIERELNAEFPWRKLEVTTLYEYVSSWKLFVRSTGIDVEILNETIHDFAEFENVKEMSKNRRDWCEAFLHDHHKQVALLSLPENLFRSASEAMRHYATASKHMKNRAIALSIAACAAGIWTSLPLRSSTLLNLTFGGEDGDVQIYGDKKNLILTTPPDIVKNGYSHRYIELTPKPGGNPRAILKWFVEDVRPVLLKYHIAPHLKRTDQLFCGVPYTRLNSIWRNATLEAGVPMTPHQVRHALATLMANAQGADYSIIAALLGDTEMTVRKNYVFVDQSRKHEEGQRLLSQIQGNILMKGATA